MDDALQDEMVDETQDIALNLADVVGGGGKASWRIGHNYDLYHMYQI